MSGFENIKEALKYIDSHLDEELTFESLARRFHFSPYYFHRMFSVIVGKTITAHIRDRRLDRACVRLSNSAAPVLEIGLDCGFNSAQAFSRGFKERYGLSPNDYRKQKSCPGFLPVPETAEEMIVKFTNRLRGGMLVNPKIIKRGSLMVAGTSGDGGKTGDVWYEFKRMINENSPENILSENGYEIRLYDGNVSTVHVGYLVSDNKNTGGCKIFKLPPSNYASFEVYVANGYDSENNAMNEWLATNKDGWSERLLDGGVNYCVEYYDERFNGSENGSIVEIWLPIKRE